MLIRHASVNAGIDGLIAAPSRLRVYLQAIDLDRSGR